MSADVNYLPGGKGYFVSGDGRTFIYANDHELLLNLDGNFKDWELEKFLAREFPGGLTKETADEWINRP